MSTRERRQRRAGRLRGWADGREQKADAAEQASRDATAGIPLGQPIIVGHHSEKRHRAALRRGDRQMSAAVDHARKASDMRERTASIERGLDRAIYDDDPDAIERLHQKLTGLEAERERIKAYNAGCCKAARTGGTGDLSLLDERQRRELAATRTHASYQIGPGGATPAYWLQNLGGNIKRTRDRLARLRYEHDHGPRDRIIPARFDSNCEACGADLKRGDMIRHNREAGPACVTCQTKASEQ